MEHSDMERPSQSPELSIIETLWDRLDREHNQQSAKNSFVLFLNVKCTTV